jgi:flagellar biosynthesis/type III secretory pathway M-ring protein FliF/YscJ
MLQTASFVGFFRTILIILLVYYGIKILTRLFAPYFLRYMSKKMQEKFEGQFQQQQRPQNPKQKEGETVIDKVPQQHKTSDKSVGEYVDYEEIE